VSPAWLSACSKAKAWRAPEALEQVQGPYRISHKVFFESFCKSQFPQNPVNLFFILVIVKDKLTDLWGG